MSTVKIKGMSCQHCVKSVTEAMEKLEGSSNVKVNLDAGEASYDGDVDLDTVKAAIAGIGFEVIG